MSRFIHKKYPYNCILYYLDFHFTQDKVDEAKKARKEENGAGSEGEDIDEEEEEGVEAEDEDDEEELPEGYEEELEGEGNFSFFLSDDCGS